MKIQCLTKKMNMKRNNFILGLIFLVGITGISLTSCQKSSNSPATTTFTAQQTEQVQNSDAQDALADKTEEDVDNNLDELENNNYNSSVTKSGLSNPTDTLIITVNHPDTTTFPKVVTLSYYSYVDSSADEPITKNGTITVTISLADPTHPKLVTRSMEFTNFAITTDSTTVILNGTRTVDRVKATLKLSWQLARISVTDNITAALKYAVVTTGSVDTLSFTRNVSKVRTAIAYYKNVNFKANDPAYNLTHLRFRHEPSLDTLSYTGSVTGINEKGNTYTKTITSPLEITVYKGSLVITSGTMTYVTSAGDSYSITFEQDPSHPHFTQVTVENVTTGKTKTFDRRFGRLFKKWW